MSECRSCHAPILWAKTRKAGKPIPLDPTEVIPGLPGALVVVQGWAYGLADLLARAGAEETARHPAYLSHWATCPNAGSHR